MPGLFVTFEGGEGSGKSTLLVRLADRLRKDGIDPLVTREPGGTPLAEGIRKLLFDPVHVPGPLAEALLMVAARADLVGRVLRPARESGRILLCDRYADSTVAYQGGGRGLEPELLDRMNRAAIGDLVPDLTFLCDLDPAAGIERRKRAGVALNRLDHEPLDFHRRVRARFIELAGRDPERFVILDAGRAPDEVEAEAWEALRLRMPS